MTRRTGTPTRSRQGRRSKLTLIDRLMLAGCVGGALYLLMFEVFGAPAWTAVTVGLVAFGFAGGVLMTVTRKPRLRSPIVWRTHR
ncbi:hypothetical protein [Thermomonospora umbrina]|uniref:Uncharacterized protein n=1 Tax=Thermomonospora umbrina TaxID=111806 RepID=A0A3D9SL37_9ACTN|nr:hypothetical protein [Thermomonospora umbrina]REE96642.1 hypothetical protein DFJ69_2082 [Thermomonospora umbrina]